MHQIPLILTELSTPSVIIKSDDELPENNFIGIILSGGPDHIYESNSRKLPEWINQLNVPVLGICYGMQLIVHHLGGNVIPLPKDERGPTLIYSVKDDPLLGNFTARTVWMNHFDIVTDVPDKLEVTSVSQNGYISSVNDKIRWFGVQFHPENIVGLDFGYEIFKKFIKICLR